MPRPAKHWHDKRAMISFTVLLMLLLTLPAPLALAGDSHEADAPADNTVIDLGDAVASVNGVLIERAAFERNFRRVLSYLNPEDARGLAHDVLQSLIEQELIIQYAEDMNIRIDDDEVKAEIRILQDSVVDASWEDWLEQNALTEADLHRETKLQLLNMAVRQQVASDLDDAVSHVSARHILVSSPAQARYVLARLEAGMEFAVLAAAVSLDVSTRDSGGDLGWFALGELLDDRLAEAAFGLADGEITGPVATSLGFHILQRLGNEMRRVDASKRPLLAEKRFQLWLEARLQEAEIIINLDLLDELYG